MYMNYCIVSYYSMKTLKVLLSNAKPVLLLVCICRLLKFIVAMANFPVAFALDVPKRHI